MDSADSMAATVVAWGKQPSCVAAIRARARLGSSGRDTIWWPRGVIPPSMSSASRTHSCFSAPSRASLCIAESISSHDKNVARTDTFQLGLSLKCRCLQQLSLMPWQTSPLLVSTNSLPTGVPLVGPAGNPCEEMRNALTCLPMDNCRARLFPQACAASSCKAKEAYRCAYNAANIMTWIGCLLANSSTLLLLRVVWLLLRVVMLLLYVTGCNYDAAAAA